MKIKEIIHYQVNWFEKNSAEHMCANASIHKDNEHIVISVIRDNIFQYSKERLTVYELLTG